jgi:hypothetical protein
MAAHAAAALLGSGGVDGVRLTPRLAQLIQLAVGPCRADMIGRSKWAPRAVESFSYPIAGSSSRDPLGAAPRPTPGRSPSNEGRDAACWVPLLAPAPGRLTRGRVPGAPVPPAAHHRRQEHSPVPIAGTLPGRGVAGRGLLQPVRALAGQAGSDECRAVNRRRGACRQRPAGGGLFGTRAVCAPATRPQPL